MKQFIMHVTLVLVLAALTAALPRAGAAQPSQIPSHREPYLLASGTHAGAGDQMVLAFTADVRVSDAPWLRLHFGPTDLGEESYLVMTSLKDGAWQRLDAVSLYEWNAVSAAFNGDAIRIELHAAPGDRDVSFSINEVTIGEWVGGVPIIESLCGSDDRVSSFDPREGRVRPVGCTGWIVSNGAHLAAGHCTNGTGNNMQFIEFQVPASLCDGTIQNADPNDQYPIDATSIAFTNGGIGNDWTVYGCFPNTNTGRLPAHAQEGFFRMTRDVLPTDVTITGYGVDSTPPGCTSGRNDDNQTQQTNSGTFLQEVTQGPSDVYLEYTVDTTGGNSGSAVIVLGTGMTLGIHTHAGCNPPNDGNHGTSFENDNLENAAQVFPALNTVYVDAGHTASLKEGTVFRPYDLLADAVASATSGATLSIVTGSYSEPMTINTAMTLTAPVGIVIIGQ
jgi:V8-like Glu-specific endopeptidase